MKKLLLVLFAFCFLLTGCNKQEEQQNNDSTSSSCETPFYTNEEIRMKLKSSLFEYQDRIKDKAQINITGEFNAPDTEFSGMFLYKDINVAIDTIALNPYLELKTNIYLKENNVINEEPDQRIEMIRCIETGSFQRKDTVDYVLEEYVDDKNKIYSKTVDEYGGLAFDTLIQAVSLALKQVKIDADIPKSIEYSYNREEASYGMKVKFKDLDGTPLAEYLNIFLSFVPELNELILKFKDDIIINLNNIKLDTPNATVDIDILYPAMQGAFEFEIIHGSFNISFAPFMRKDVTKLKVEETYLKGKNGTNNVTNYLNPVVNDDVISYKAGIVLDGFSGIDITKLIDPNKQPDLNDILQLLKNKKYKVTASDSTSIKILDRFSKEPIEVKNDTIELSLLDTILIEIYYENSGSHLVTIKEVKNEDTTNNNNNENL